MKQIPLYLDVNATTRPHPQVLENLPQWVQCWGNPSSIHQWGREAKKILRESRRSIAKRLGISPVECIFTSGGSEANGLAIFGSLKGLRARGNRRNRVILGSIEHPSVAKTAPVLRSMGYDVKILPAQREGFYDERIFHELLTDDVALVSVMWANNELGTIAPIKAFVEKAHGVGSLFHSDCVQTLGKIPVDFSQAGVDYASFSGHKFGGLKGAGFLYVKKGSPLESVINGGGQERGRRAGTENLLAIRAMAEAVNQLPSDLFQTDRSLTNPSPYGLSTANLSSPNLSPVILSPVTLTSVNCSSSDFVPTEPTPLHEEPLQSQWPQWVKDWAARRDQLEAWMEAEIPGLEILGRPGPRLPNTSCLILDGVDGEALMIQLDLKGYGVSTGAACSSGNPEPNPVLLSLRIPRHRAQNSLRLSLPCEVTLPQLRDFVTSLGAVVTHLRRLAGFSDTGERQGHDPQY